MSEVDRCSYKVQLMLIVFIWLGSILPPKYYDALARCESYPQNQCVVLGQFHYSYYVSKYRNLLNLSQNRLNSMVLVERSDVLRLLYIYEKGGIYSDTDNVIDYDCLYSFIQQHKEGSFFGHRQIDPSLPSNNFLYASAPKEKELERVISRIHQCEECIGMQFASPNFQTRIGVKFLNIEKCVDHKADNTWFWWGGKGHLTPATAQSYAQCLNQKSQCELDRKKEGEIWVQSLQVNQRQEGSRLISCEREKFQIRDELDAYRFANGSCLQKLSNCQKNNEVNLLYLNWCKIMSSFKVLMILLAIIVSLTGYTIFLLRKIKHTEKTRQLQLNRVENEQEMQRLSG